MEGEIVNRTIKATENTTLAKLSVFDQIKLFISKFNNDDAAELKANAQVSAIALSMQASLEKLFLTAAEGLENGKHKSATLSVSSKYLPYLDKVIDEKYGLGRYYNFTVYNRDLPITVDYSIIVRIERKVT